MGCHCVNNEQILDNLNSGVYQNCSDNFTILVHTRIVSYGQFTYVPELLEHFW